MIVASTSVPEQSVIRCSARWRFTSANSFSLS